MVKMMGRSFPSQPFFRRKQDKIRASNHHASTASGINGTPERVREAAEKSLKYLGVKTIIFCTELTRTHRSRYEEQLQELEGMSALIIYPRYKMVGAMAEVVKEGKPWKSSFPPFCLDIEDEEIDLMKTCRELGITFVAHSPLGRGMLTGSTFGAQKFPNILKLVKGFQGLGEKHHATAGQVTLAWLLAQGEDIIPIPGAKKIKYLKENLSDLKINLTPSEVAESREIARKADAVQGDRYPPPYMENLFLDTPPLISTTSFFSNTQ
ncbi:hypothetical protein M413DRAFT_31534 [Hebeloma cylindrosporum]|uniref:NADP-dependent oxidoreductase domain-containing protein n=1 Tax=Hebeloma cylindrosporum TaxID=76867 RepID=A0A0C2XFL2_HEBCY|nr:hypothetical protein M413DRAFT_31534 [Hebeloma cylindrosporum h7]